MVMTDGGGGGGKYANAAAATAQNGERQNKGGRHRAPIGDGSW